MLMHEPACWHLLCMLHHCNCFADACNSMHASPTAAEACLQLLQSLWRDGVVGSSVQRTGVTCIGLVSLLGHELQPQQRGIGALRVVLQQVRMGALLHNGPIPHHCSTPDIRMKGFLAWVLGFRASSVSAGVPQLLAGLCGSLGIVLRGPERHVHSAQAHADGHADFWL